MKRMKKNNNPATFLLMALVESIFIWIYYIYSSVYNTTINQNAFKYKPKKQKKNKKWKDKQ